MISLDECDDWVFWRKGNANAIYRYVGQDPAFDNKLLRLRLEDQDLNTIQVYNFIQKDIRPILSEFLQMELVKVEFKKDGLLNDGYGLLMPNLIPEGAKVVTNEKYYKVYKGNDTVILELKPKWLIETKYGCRNCANYKQKQNKTPSFCVLFLLDDASVKTSVDKVFEDDERARQAFSSYFQSKNSILSTLKGLQKEISLDGVTSEDHVTDHLKIQMSLRDVTVFCTLKDSTITATVTDADPKSPKKWKQWKETERQLVEQSYYINH